MVCENALPSGWKFKQTGHHSPWGVSVLRPGRMGKQTQMPWGQWQGSGWIPMLSFFGSTVERSGQKDPVKDSRARASKIASGPFWEGSRARVFGQGFEDPNKANPVWWRMCTGERSLYVDTESCRSLGPRSGTGLCGVTHAARAEVCRFGGRPRIWAVAFQCPASAVKGKAYVRRSMRNPNGPGFRGREPD